LQLTFDIAMPQQMQGEVDACFKGRVWLLLMQMQVVSWIPVLDLLNISCPPKQCHITQGERRALGPPNKSGMVQKQCEKEYEVPKIGARDRIRNASARFFEKEGG